MVKKTWMFVLPKFEGLRGRTSGSLKIGENLANCKNWQVFQSSSVTRVFDSNESEAMMLFCWASRCNKGIRPLQSLPSFILAFGFCSFTTPSDCFKSYSELLCDYTVFRCFVSEDHRGRKTPHNRFQVRVKKQIFTLQKCMIWKVLIMKT